MMFMNTEANGLEYIEKKVNGDCAVFPGTVTITITYEKINDGEKISKVYMQCGWQENCPYCADGHLNCPIYINAPFIV